jgi:hypothetical protein
MAEYFPDKWLIVEVLGDDPHYRVFAVWSGGYLSPDSWRLNSGIVDVEEDDEFYYFYGKSKSVYQCNKQSYGTNSYGIEVLHYLQSYDTEKCHIKILTEREMKDINWDKI